MTHADMQQWLEALEPDTTSLAYSGRSTDYIDGYESGFERAKDAAIATLRARLTAPVQPLPSDHVCGLQGFDGMRDECPGCERNARRRSYTEGSES